MLHLGKLPARQDSHDLKFTTYVDVERLLPKVPDVIRGHASKVKTWGMLGNGPDPTVAPGFGGAGDCVFAGACHETMLVNAANGVSVPFTGAQAIAAYETVTGYVLNDESTDQGTDPRKALGWRQRTGLADAKGKVHKIAAYMPLEPGNLDHLYLALYLTGIAGIGIEFPESAMTQFDQGQPWTIVPGARNDGGHYIPLTAKHHGGDLDCVTWGRIQKMAAAFYRQQCDEAYAIVSAEYVNAHTHKSPEGFELAALLADVKALRS